MAWVLPFVNILTTHGVLLKEHLYPGCVYFSFFNLIVEFTQKECNCACLLPAMNNLSNYSSISALINTNLFTYM